MISITIQQPTVPVIGFGFPLATCIYHPPPKDSLALGGWVFSQFKTLQVTRQFALPGFQTTLLSAQHLILISSNQLLHYPRLGHLKHHIQGQLGFFYLFQRINIRLSAFSGHLFKSAHQSANITMDYLKTIVYHLLAYAMLMSFSKHERIKELNLSVF